MVDELLASVFEALSLAVWERTAPYSFRDAGQPPPFAERLFIEPQRRGVLPWQRSPMLDHFLEQAEPFWMLGSRGVLRSPLWVEQDDLGREYALEALAICPGERRVLVIRELGKEYEEQLRLMRHYREGRERPQRRGRKARA